MKILSVILAVLMTGGEPLLCQQSTVSTPATSQAPAPQAAAPAAPTTAPAAAPTTAPPAPNTLLDGTAIKMRLGENLSSETNKTGDQVSFETTEDVMVDGALVIPKGSQALATVTLAEKKKSMGRGGKLNVNVDSVRLADNEKAQLRASKDTNGGGHIGVMTTAMVATAIVFFPAAPLFLFIHGKPVNIPKGTEVIAFVQGDMRLNMSKFGVTPTAAGAVAPALVATAPVAATPAPVAAEPTLASLMVESSVAGADIEIDGNFVGSTPSTVSIPPGQHTIVVKKKGYADWSRTMNVAGSSVHLNADLEAKP